MKITNNNNLPQVFVDIMEEEYEYTPNEYSVTEILNGITEINLTRQHYDNIVVDVSDMANLIFGQAVHHLLELKDKNNMTEYNVKREVKDGMYLKGRFDAYDPKTYTLIDYKTCSKWKIKNQDFSDWRKQGLMYAWLMNSYVDKIQFIALVKDVNSRDDIPPIYVYEFNVLPSDLREIEVFINERFSQLGKDVPCTPEERWFAGDKFAVMKNGGKRAIKVYDTREEADQDDRGDYVEVRKGENKKCDNYCNVKQWCPYYMKGVI